MCVGIGSEEVAEVAVGAGVGAGADCFSGNTCGAVMMRVRARRKPQIVEKN